MSYSLDDAAAALLSAALRAPKMAGMIIHKTTFDIQADAQQLAPHDTGNLKNSIQAKTPDALTGIVSVGAAYGWFVEAGTRPHEIRPKNGKFLKFAGRNGTVFTSKVSHPGTKPQPYIEPAVERRLPGLIQAAGKLVSEIL